VQAGVVADLDRRIGQVDAAVEKTTDRGRGKGEQRRPRRPLLPLLHAQAIRQEIRMNYQGPLHCKVVDHNGAPHIEISSQYFQDAKYSTTTGDYPFVKLWARHKSTSRQ
jgi:hypothetical protein